MRLSAKTKLSLWTLSLVLFLPSTLWAQSSPVPDLEFSNVTTLNATLVTRSIQRFRLLAGSRIRFANETLSASVEGEVITFEEFELVNGGTSVLVSIDPADLSTDRRGSSFSAPATFSIETNAGTVDVTGQVRGRIALRRGTYHLSAVASGALVVPGGGGNGTLHLIAIPLSGTAIAETEVDVMVE